MRFFCVFVLAIAATTRVYGNTTPVVDDGRGDLSNGDEPIKFSDLPKDVQSDVHHILTGAVNALGGSCLGVEPDYDKVELLLFHHDPQSYTRITPENTEGIDLNAPLYILSHGYLSGLNGYKIKAFRDKYIELYGKNILFVHWGKIAWLAYQTCACNIPFIGTYVAKLLCNLHEKHNYDLKNVHVIGHSLGGQFAGHVGKGTQKQCNKKIGKITGLDPAGPAFQFKHEDGRLNPTDADFVEVLHSNAGFFGYLGKCGTVDYHLNCGSIQPGCIIPEDFSKIAETNIYMLCCPHMRSVEIWPYVLDTKDFKGKSCKLCAGLMPSTCHTDVIGANFVSLGFTYSKPRDEHYSINTGPYKPFKLGCAAYPLQGCV